MWVRRPGEKGRADSIHGEKAGGKGSWNGVEFEGWYRNLVQWKLPKLYENDANEVS